MTKIGRNTPSAVEMKLLNTCEFCLVHVHELKVLSAGLSIEAGSRRKSAGCQTTLRRLLLPVLAVKNLKYIL